MFSTVHRVNAQFLFTLSAQGRLLCPRSSSRKTHETSKWATVEAHWFIQVACRLSLHFRPVLMLLSVTVNSAGPRRYWDINLILYGPHKLGCWAHSSFTKWAQRTEHLMCTYSQSKTHKVTFKSKAHLLHSNRMKIQPWVPSRRDITDLQKKKCHELMWSTGTNRENGSSSESAAKGRK